MDRQRLLRGDEGVALVEISMISLLLFTLIFGVFEFGLVFRDRLTLGDAVGDGARLGSVQGPDLTEAGGTADYSILKSIRESTAGIDPETIDRIVIFKGSSAGAGSPASQVPASCKAGTAVSGRCNVYDPVFAFAKIQAGEAAWFNCATTPGSPACSWNPLHRSDGPDPSVIDYIGVWMRVRHPFITGLFGEDIVIEQASVTRLEPGLQE